MTTVSPKKNHDPARVNEIAEKDCIGVVQNLLLIPSSSS